MFFLFYRKSEEQEDCAIVHAYLTYVQLPWYTMAEGMKIHDKLSYKFIFDTNFNFLLHDLCGSIIFVCDVL